MAEYVFTLRNVRKAHGDKVVLDNVTLSFLHGAKIGVVGPNGTGKSTLLKIMAGLDHASNGDATIDPDATVGMLQQEPPLTEGRTVLENVEEAVGEVKGKLDRYNSTWPLAIELVSSGRIDVAPLVTHHFPLAESADALTLGGRVKDSVKAVIHPQL